VLQRGCVVEGGTHKQLLAQNGLYAQMWSEQTS
jgi:ATP-binding cassette subfamily B multidrug efflux pump